MTDNKISLNGCVVMEITETLDKHLQAAAAEHPLMENEVLAGIAMATGKHMLRVMDAGTCGTSDQGIWDMHMRLIAMVVNRDMENIKTSIVN